ncbi:lipopolysaccharide transport system ATP-binding protein [Flavobacterium sp. CG_9.10]|uniref:ABC transporter ATP-binding protein n=1 Tax=Flavobacterium sp. CG_9.10 TaxID=2787729 RepID=UPI0018CA5D7D|nr:ABC transporter ATP-binding protein [Flavobacterium sp. CG_9.10]MBG6109814.1 lipopolysaccharide transport system ATP-binding protein [Flavobacterium sp. CG_9.10]
MSKDIILKAENISKQYRLGQVGTGTLSHDLNRWWHQIRGKENPYLKIGDVNDRSTKGSSDYVWALQDINFEVERGEVLGIIGKNGAGKSTLLKILSKVTAPTTGSIKSRGRIASLLEVGTGFNGEMTGRENIFLNGAILGMTKKEIASKLDEIIDFSGCERYIDTPVKRYSSGMTVRLAFAVAAFLEPEILVIDEVLAVGDAEFQKKAIGKMQDISREGGRTVLFVSHNMAAVRSLCTKGILLENGKIVFEGGIEPLLNLYLKSNQNRNYWKGEDGDKSMRLLNTEIYNELRSKNLKNTDLIHIVLKFEIGEKFKDIVIGATICTPTGNPIVGLLYNDYNNLNEILPGTYEVIFTIPSCSLATGDYEIEFNLSIPFVKKYTCEKSNLSFAITAESDYGNRFYVENSLFLNSIIRPNWFNSINKIN